MKKIIAMLLALVMTLALAACNTDTQNPTGDSEVTVMTHEEYMAAEKDSEVTVEFFVQGAQGWWFDDDAGHGKITVYGQDENGGYFGYDLKCAEADAAKVVPGAKIRVTGYKAEWSGEIEVMDGTFTFVDAEPYIAEALDVTKLLGTDELIKHQNKKVCFKGMKIAASNNSGAAFLYKWDGSGSDGDDLYFQATVGGATYSFCVESYLTGAGTDVYEAVKTLKVGDTVDMEGFLYWYEGSQPHITAVTVKK